MIAWSGPVKLAANVPNVENGSTDVSAVKLRTLLPVMAWCGSGEKSRDVGARR